MVTIVFPNIPVENIIGCEDAGRKFLDPTGNLRLYREQVKLLYPRANVPYLEIDDFTYFGKIDVMSELRNGEVSCKIGIFCSIGPNLIVLLGEEHNTSWISTYPFELMDSTHKTNSFSKGDVAIGNDVWIGRDSKILSGVQIGDGCVIGAGCVVTKSVEPYSIVVGNPGRVVKKRFLDDQIEKLLEM